MSTNMDLKDIPLGKCFKCGWNQTTPTKGGYWLNGMTMRFACENCFYGKDNHGNKIGDPMRSHPLGCEWCSYRGIEKAQGNVYECKRCNLLHLRD